MHKTFFAFYTFSHLHFAVSILRFRIMELSLLRTFAPGSESTMVWNLNRSRELKFPGAKVPRTFVNFRSLEPSLPGTFAPGSKIPRTFAPTPSDVRSRHSFMDTYAYAVASEF